MTDALLAVLLAPSCAACDQSLDHPTAGPVCEACWSSILPLTPPLCDACGDPLATWRVSDPRLPTCTRCRRLRRSIAKARSVGWHEGALRSIIHAWKYEGRRSLACPLAALARMRGGDVLEGADYAVAVPLHRARRRERGFNQSDDLARHIGLPVVAALARVRPTRVQAELPAARRHGNVKGAFAPRRSAALLRGRIVVLVDDVCTTGATLDACARVLLADGAREVRALTVARAPTRPR